MRHDLTEEIAIRFLNLEMPMSVTELEKIIDPIVREWLGARADEIHSIRREGYKGTEVREILGLTEPRTEKECSGWDHTKGASNDCSGECFAPQAPKPKPKEWCSKPIENWTAVDYNEFWEDFFNRFESWEPK